jgi:hypothetical protein
MIDRSTLDVAETPSLVRFLLICGIKRDRWPDRHADRDTTSHGHLAMVA